MISIKSLFLALFLSLLSCSAFAQIGTPTLLGSGASSTNLTITSLGASGVTITAGDLIVVYFGSICTGAGTTPITATSVSDGTNTYALAKAASRGASTPGDVEIWYISNAQAVTSGTVTVNFSNSCGSGGAEYVIRVAQVSGIAAASAFDSAAAKSGTGTNGTVSVTSNALAQSSEIVFGATHGSGVGDHCNSTPSGFNSLFGVQGDFDYQIVSSTSAVTLTCSYIVSNWEAIVVPFIAGAAASVCTMAMTGAGSC